MPTITGILSVSTFCTSIFLILLCFFVLFKNRKSPINFSFFLVCCSAAIWLFSYSQAYRLADSNIIKLWFKVGYQGVIFISITYFHFTSNFLRLRRTKWIVILNYFIGIALIFILWRTDLLISGVNLFPWGYYPKAGIIHPYFLVLFLGIVNAASCQLAYFYFFRRKTLPLVKQQQIKYILFAFVVFTVASADFIPNYGLAIYPIGFVPVTLFLILITHSIVRYRLLDVSIVITRTGIFVVVYSLVLGIPFAMAFGFREKLIGILGADWWLMPLISSTILATAGPFIYLFIQRRAEDRLLKEQKRYQLTLRQASSGMGRIKDVKRLTNLIVHIVTRTVHIEHCTVYLYNPIDKVYFWEAYRKLRPTDVNGQISEDSPLVKYLVKSKYPVVYEEVKQRIQDYEDKELIDVEASVRQLDAALVVPSFIEDKLIAIIILGRKRSGQLFSEDDLTVFSILANQAALSIENCQFYEDVKKTHEQLFQAEKMATIGTMADGLSHQINNRLHAMGFIASDALDTIRMKSPAEISVPVKEIIDAVQYSLTRIQENVKQGGEVVQGLLKYTRKGEIGFSPVDLDKLIDSSVDMVRYKIKLDQFSLIRDYPKDLPKIKGNFTQLQEVFFNLIDNAYDAIMQRKVEEKDPGYKGKIQITAMVRNSTIEISVLDNGMGVKSQDENKLFTPFFTTKLSSKKGTGLGLYVIKRIIEDNHGGKIKMSSEYLVGTLFTINLSIAWEGNERNA